MLNQHTCRHACTYSIVAANQWWVGTLAGNPPRFTPERVGILDYGNGYAAKSGAEWVQSGQSRRLMFGFTGWSEPTMPTGCGRALVMPRELSVVGSTLHITPISETAVLRVPGSRKTSYEPQLDSFWKHVKTPLATGSQVRQPHIGQSQTVDSRLY